ncbi:hypothetical protein JTE90_021498 [Oedothorax gibbosus]|uniref:Mutator-like transposase domain-containing protein n=1 Tax=Oedothorax gibbosus TaxID=931172 RepID=A0AAV6VR68_9ARAC|nr:hypothetical protein JTE90_021498 [Oedothorax gibbosus]
MAKAAMEEKRLAVEAKYVDPDGFPFLTVVLDECWEKRSYKTNNKSISVVATIVGFRTKQVLYMGVGNRYLTLCSRNFLVIEGPCKDQQSRTRSSTEVDWKHTIFSMRKNIVKAAAHWNKEASPKINVDLKKHLCGPLVSLCETRCVELEHHLSVTSFLKRIEEIIASLEEIQEWSHSSSDRSSLIATTFVCAITNNLKNRYSKEVLKAFNLQSLLPEKCSTATMKSSIQVAQQLAKQYWKVIENDEDGCQSYMKAETKLWVTKWKREASRKTPLPNYALDCLK